MILFLYDTLGLLRHIVAVGDLLFFFTGWKSKTFFQFITHNFPSSSFSTTQTFTILFFVAFLLFINVRFLIIIFVFKRSMIPYSNLSKHHILGRYTNLFFFFGSLLLRTNLYKRFHSNSIVAITNVLDLFWIIGRLKNSCWSLRSAQGSFLFNVFVGK